MKNIKAVLFDLDGTLLDTYEFIYQAFEYSCHHHHLPVPDRKNITKVVGQSLEKCYSSLCPKSNVNELCKTHREFQTKNLGLSIPFSHTVETLEQLKSMSFILGVVTTRFKITVQKTLELAGIGKYFNIVITGDEVEDCKPSPEGILKALKKIKIHPNNAVMIGDTESDILAGKNAEVITIGVTYGFQGQKIKESTPNFIANDILEIVSILKDGWT